MRGKVCVVSLWVIVVMWGFSGASAAVMAPDHLHGKWVLGVSEQTCGAPNAEYFIFRDNGTFEAGRADRAEAVGFWQLGEETVQLHFVSSFGFYHDIAAELKDMQGQFHYLASKLLFFNVEDDRFDVVGVLEDQAQKGIAIRCP